ncbi:GGDEF domain-containing phosphodiesterase [Stakelama sp. CBK3Z-3]|uniref:GGDEF domain-containing phosphodiesterase n=2 Tax=Stakelama flava TaxID=2860338 RepID=A0ABS6XJ47_9SPHN|nr:GGDEF domain-containing phosphodiesterase [Stakelama flava]MBW4329431.1 GGDEF domain-containing phosphodiesterase [Stakelama flava]
MAGNGVGAGREPIFLLSFRHRDELAATVSRAGWSVVAARRPEGVEQRLLASGAAVVLVDARGAVKEALAATSRLAGHVGGRGGALIILVSRNMVGSLGAFLSAGATHFLTSPISQSELVHGIRFAEAHCRRSMPGVAQARQDERASGLLQWRWDGGATLMLSPALAAALDCDRTLPVREALRMVAVAERAALLAAIRRLRSGAVSQAVVHTLAGLGRVVEHLGRTAGGREIRALLEPPAEGVPPPVSLDWLTGVLDASGAREWLQRNFAGSAPVSGLLVGLAGFEIVNTGLGRAVGDALLRGVAAKLSEKAAASLGGDAVVARLGGADFLVAAPCEGQRMELFGGEMQHVLSRPLSTPAGETRVGARLAVTERREGDEPATFLRRAAEALALAREGQVSARAEPAHQSVEQLAVDIRAALDEEQIEIRFQPQVEIASGAIVGVEALARWRHPVLGELGAELLLTAAERAGLAGAVSAAIQRAALDAAARWPKALQQLRMSVNITADDVARPGFADTLLGRIDASGFPRSRLTLEVTETGLMEDLGAAADLFSQLRTAQCRVAIDDFGTGYSSLAYLKALPLDYLKIDRKLSQDIGGSARDRVVVRGVIEMARSLGLGLIAEGVETEAQLDLLAKEGCQFFQGFLCAEPLTVDALEALVSK